MSGSSLDGLDLAACTFHFVQQQLSEWQMLQAHTAPFPTDLRHRLATAPKASGKGLWLLHVELGSWMGQQARTFLDSYELNVQLIASHGHTVFHMPEHHATAQIGDGASLAIAAHLPVACDFRSVDVATGGQGAPLAPLADRWLFPGYDCYLNLGGIANLSVRQADNTFIAGDLTGCNQILDALAREAGREWDENGQLAASGTVLSELLKQLAQLSWFEKSWPRSLSNAWVQSEQLPLLMQHEGHITDLLRTAVEHIAQQVADAVRLYAPHAQRMLITGGGALNTFLLTRIEALLPRYIEGVVPHTHIIQYKEAALMAFMGALRWFGWPNTLATATGAPYDTVGGALYEPFPQKLLPHEST